MSTLGPHRRAATLSRAEKWWSLCVCVAGVGGGGWAGLSHLPWTPGQLSNLPGRPPPVALQVLGFAPVLIIPRLFLFLFLPPQKIALSSQEGLATGCPTGLACVRPQAFAQAVRSACLEWLFPDVSSAGNPSRQVTNPLGQVLSVKFSRTSSNTAFHPSVVMSLSLQTRCCASGDHDPERKLSMWDWNFPQRYRPICFPERFKVNPIGI